jgi:ketosteroid isomerase-like protein
MTEDGAMSEEESRLREIDRAWNEAYPKRDVATLKRIIADDWIAIDGAGLVITKKLLLERVASAPSQFESHQFEEISLRIFGDAAIVMGQLSGRGRDDDGGVFDLLQRYTRVYVRRENLWQAVATQVTVAANQSVS